MNVRSYEEIHRFRAACIESTSLVPNEVLTSIVSSEQKAYNLHKVLSEVLWTLGLTENDGPIINGLIHGESLYSIVGGHGEIGALQQTRAYYIDAIERYKRDIVSSPMWPSPSFGSLLGQCLMSLWYFRSYVCKLDLLGDIKGLDPKDIDLVCIPIVHNGGPKALKEFNQTGRVPFRVVDYVEKFLFYWLNRDSLETGRLENISYYVR